MAPSRWAAIFLAVSGAVVFLFPVSVSAECSPFAGQASINELHRKNKDAFIEVKILNSNLDPSTYADWTFRYESTEKACSELSIGEDFDDIDAPWLVAGEDVIDDKKCLEFGAEGNNEKGMEARLEDSKGRVIDYVSVNDYSDDLEPGPSCDLPLDTTMENTNSHTIIRSPDGTGDWAYQGPGGSEEDTEGGTNIGDHDIEDLAHATIQNITVLPGSDAEFTIQLQDYEGNEATFGSDITITYETQDGDDEYEGATSPDSYTATSGEVTIPAGESKATVTVPTEPVATTGSFFYLVLTDGVREDEDNDDPVVFENHFAIAEFTDLYAAVDHIRLEHDGLGVTCMPAPVTVKACLDADCNDLYDEEIAVEFTSPASGWTPDPVTFTGSTQVHLAVQAAGVVTLDTGAPDTQCINGGGGKACELEFSETGIIIDGQDGDTNPASAVPVQIAGKPSTDDP
ncbi:MAG: hypothetical protein ACQERG_08630, partial [Pseudomonadota bacterium]